MMSSDQGSAEETTAVRKNVEQASVIAEHLMKSSALAAVLQRRGGSISEEAWEIGTGLADIKESTTRLFDDLIPALLHADPASAEVENLLHEIGEEYRHILYHITNTRFFSHVVPESEE